MKASEAKELSNNGKEVDEKELQSIYDYIRQHASLGNTVCSIDWKSGMIGIKKRLEDDGYKCEVTTDRNDSILLIRW